jgi:hypothetical protein
MRSTSVLYLLKREMRAGCIIISNDLKNDPSFESVIGNVILKVNIA